MSKDRFLDDDTRLDYQYAVELARSRSSKAMRKLFELIDSDDPRVAAIAVKEVLDRAWGKPAQAIAIGKPEEFGPGLTVILQGGEKREPPELKVVNGTRVTPSLPPPK